MSDRPLFQTWLLVMRPPCEISSWMPAPVLSQTALFSTSQFVLSMSLQNTLSGVVVDGVVVKDNIPAELTNFIPPEVVINVVAASVVAGDLGTIHLERCWLKWPSIPISPLHGCTVATIDHAVRAERDACALGSPAPSRHSASMPLIWTNRLRW